MKKLNGMDFYLLRKNTLPKPTDPKSKINYYHFTDIFKPNFNSYSQH